jgi:fluoroquinolone transport system permease protein
MKKWLLLIQNDLSRIVRDKTMLMFASTPVLLLVFIRYAVPIFGQMYPIITEYYRIIVLFGGIQTGVLFGFISGFVFLEEKDENVFDICKILPVKPFQFVGVRLFFTFAMSALGSFLILKLNGMIEFSKWEVLSLSVQFALGAVVLSLCLGVFAKNKIEGMALFKGLDLLILIPIMSYFIHHPMMGVLSILPSYWTYQTGLNGIEHLAINTSVSMIYNSLIIYILMKRLFQ